MVLRSSFFVFGWCAVASMASAEIINVPEDYASIQEAINASSDGDLIEIAAGTYYERNINPGGRAITIRGAIREDGAPAVTIDAQSYFGVAVLVCRNGETNATVIENMVVTGGFNIDGGGMQIRGSNPTLRNMTFDGNVAAEGGGLKCLESEPVLERCVFMNNAVTDVGGGIFNSGKSPTLTKCTFWNNTAANEGGGMYNYVSTPVLTECKFKDNTSIYGGGIYNYVSKVTLIESTFERNLADFGGGIYNRYGRPMLIACTFEDNIADFNGGGMHNEECAPILSSCTFEKNVAYSGLQMSRHDIGIPSIVKIRRTDWSASIFDSTFRGRSASWFRCSSSTSVAEGTKENPVTLYSFLADSAHGDIDGGWTNAGGNTFYDACHEDHLDDVLVVIESWSDCP